MPLKFGYDNTESENRLYLTYKNLSYSNILSRIIGEERRINRNLEFEISKVNSAMGLKYLAVVKNFFFFSFKKQVFSFDAEFAQKYKVSKMVSFDISPSVKISCKNNKIPIILSAKQYTIQASKNQVLLDGNQYSKVIPSFLSYKVTALSLSHYNNKDFKLFGMNNVFLYRFKLSCGKIENFEDFIKLSLGYKFLLNIPLPLDLFNLSFHMENRIKKSYAFDNLKDKAVNDKYQINANHVITNFDCFSKLLGVNILNKEGIVDNGVNFYVHSISHLRLSNIKLFRDYDLLNKIEPYVGIEALYRPIDNETEFKKKLSLIYTFGFSLKLQEYLYIDFMLKSDSYNSHIEHSKINKFRMGVEISTDV